MNADGSVLPREIAPGVFWFGECQTVRYKDLLLHYYNSAFLVAGESASLLVETGPPPTMAETEAQLERVLAGGLPPLRYLFVTHPETNHAGGTGRLLTRFPDAVLVGDPTDVHHYAPDQAHRISDRPPGEPIDLGGRRFSWLPGLFRDHRSSRWGFDDHSRVLFTGDGLAYSHYHVEGQCGHTAEEAVDLEIEEMLAVFSGASFPWTAYVEMDPYLDAMDRLFADLDVRVLAPTHGLPIFDVPAAMPKIRDGLRRRVPKAESVTLD